MTKEENPLYFLVFPITLFLIVAVAYLGVLTINQNKERNYIGLDLEKERTIYVVGEGEVSGEPDVATISFSVTNEAQTSEKAMEDNAQKMNKVISFLKEQGIEDKDLKTTNISVSPRYEYRSSERSEEYYVYPPSGERVLVAYQADQSLEVKIRDLENAGTIVEKAVKAGANQIGGLTFEIENKDELENKARQEAIKNAKEKAETLANELGIKLQKIISYNESGFIPYSSRDMSMPMMAKEMEENVVPELKPGETKIEVRVTVGYEIQY